MTPDRLECGILSFGVLLAIALIRDYFQEKMKERKEAKKPKPYTGRYYSET